jgi:hypothetical protein
LTKEAEKQKPKIEKMRKEFSQQEGLDVPIKKSFKLKAETIEKKHNQERKVLEKKHEDAMKEMLKTQKDKRANLMKAFRDTRKSALDQHKQKAAEKKDNLSKFDYQELKKGSKHKKFLTIFDSLANIVNQQLREEAEYLQKVRMGELKEVHTIQDQQLNEYGTLLLAIEAETSALKMEVVEALFKSNQESLYKKFELEVNEWQLQCDLEQLQLNQQHELQQVQQQQQLKLQNDQALQTFKSDYKVRRYCKFTNGLDSRSESSTKQEDRIGEGT